MFSFLIISVFIEHVRGLEQLLDQYKREEDEYRQRNDTKKADLFLNKKNLVGQEVNIITFVFIPNLFILLFRLKHLPMNHHRQNQCHVNVFLSFHLFALFIVFFFLICDLHGLYTFGKFLLLPKQDIQCY